MKIREIIRVYCTNTKHINTNTLCGKIQITTYVLLSLGFKRYDNTNLSDILYIWNFFWQLNDENEEGAVYLLFIVYLTMIWRGRPKGTTSNSRMKDNTGKEVIRTGRGLFQSTTPAFLRKDGVKSRNSVPAKAGTKHLPDKSQKFNLLSQFPRHSKLSRTSLATYELKNRKKWTVYMTLNTWNVELKDKICFKEHHVCH
jgi:hypothetical protein